MVLWINGAFGAGKTELARALRERLSAAVLFDPETAGLVYRKIFRAGDFQDLSIWRKTVVGWGSFLDRVSNGPILIPMTLIEPDYLNEIFAGFASRGTRVRHVFIELDEQTLRARISDRDKRPRETERDSRIRRWRLDQMARCLSAKQLMPAGTIFLNGKNTPEALAGEIITGHLG